MIIFRRSKDVHSYLNKLKSPNVALGFVPTMGALHKGHLSLIKECRQKAKISVCSIFVNPMQFNNQEDFKKYPVTLEKDILLLEESGCDILFLPGEKEIYPDEESKKIQYDLGYLETILEGTHRPGHFQGVCLVMEKLLNIINPDYLLIGRKDFQQCLVIKRLIQIMKRDVEIIVCPTLREKSGLAMSSRNLRLNAIEKGLAPDLYASLRFIQQNLTTDNFHELKIKAVSRLEKNGFKIEYLELAKTKDLRLITEFENRNDLIILIAAFLNEVRLIDNLLIN